MNVIYTIVIVTSSSPTDSYTGLILLPMTKSERINPLFNFFIPIVSYSFLLKSEVAGMTLHLSINDASFTACSARLIVIYSRV